MWYASASPVSVAPGMWVMIAPPGEKPSRPSHGVFVTCDPCCHCGSVASPK
jgi:hypothetical protein